MSTVLTTDDVISYTRQIDPRIQLVEVTTEFDGQETTVKFDISVAWDSLDTLNVRMSLTEAWTNQIKQGCVPLGCMVKCRYIEVFLRFGVWLQ